MDWKAPAHTFQHADMDGRDPHLLPTHHKELGNKREDPTACGVHASVRGGAEPSWSVLPVDVTCQACLLVVAFRVADRLTRDGIEALGDHLVTLLERT